MCKNVAGEHLAKTGVSHEMIQACLSTRRKKNRDTKSPVMISALNARKYLAQRFVKSSVLSVECIV